MDAVNVHKTIWKHKKEQTMETKHSNCRFQKLKYKWHTKCNLIHIHLYAIDCMNRVCVPPFSPIKFYFTAIKSVFHHNNTILLTQPKNLPLLIAIKDLLYLKSVKRDGNISHRNCHEMNRFLNLMDCGNKVWWGGRAESSTGGRLLRCETSTLNINIISAWTCNEWEVPPTLTSLNILCAVNIKFKLQNHLKFRPAHKHRITRLKLSHQNFHINISEN